MKGDMLFDSKSDELTVPNIESFTKSAMMAVYSAEVGEEGEGFVVGNVGT